MVATFSPHRDAGGTLHLPSPTGIHHVDASSAIRQLRRSLSRSPSKSSDFRFLSRPHSQTTPNTPFISSPLSPSRRGNLFFVPATTSNLSATTPAPSKPTFSSSLTTNTAAPPATPVAIPYPPSSKITRPLMRRTGSLPNTRQRTSPKSPSKRVLHLSSDQGNATVTPPVVPLIENENLLQEPSIISSENFQLFSSNISTDINSNFTFKPSANRIEKRRSGNFGSLTAAVSPLKRSDGAMNLDQAEFASPSAKRRSLHSVSGTPDFSIFDAADSFSSLSNDTSDAMARETEPQPFTFSSLPGGNFATIPKRSSSLRRSTLQQRQGERSLFSRSRLMNVDFPDSPSPPKSPIAAMQQRYPLGSGLSSTPSRENLFTPQTRPASSNPLFANIQHDIPSTTPHAAHPLSRTITQSSSSSSVADDSPTHEPIHKIDRPRPVFNFSKSLPVGAARPEAPRQFTREDSNASTDSFATPENYRQAKPYAAAFMSTGLISKKNRNVEDLQGSFGSSKNMPDTPCKRSSMFLPSAQKALPVRPISRPKLARQTFVAPSTPSHNAVPASGPFSRGNGGLSNVFNQPYSSRRGSFVSVDGDDRSISNSPSARHNNQGAIDLDLPPTPTKQVFSTSHLNGTPLGDPSVQLQIDALESTTPCTPKDHNIFPPDPSGLSISAPNESALSLDDLNASTITFPATPTAPRDYFAPTGQRKSMSLGGFSAMDVDTSLTTRFDKVELIGTGEFSQVYRVSNSPENSQYKSIFSLPSAGSTSPSALPDRVWAVKKSKQAFGGPKDRSRRMREVEILRALANSDHVVSFIDNWEDRGHLYIQTEYCEEGSLDTFLAQVGLKARLDDFRIWKILLELSQGLKHIHDSGFIHLDIKPANVLITFEGVLKIGDFGMATTWPAEKHIEGEGDREYMGPEVLLGLYDKPADIFALGLIMFEIAGNVELPDNGVSWQKLRNGDISDVPSLTWSSETSILRDASGNPLSESSSFDELCRSDPAFEDSGVDFSRSRVPKPQYLSRSGELIEPPTFMMDPNHEDSLDRLVRWMIAPDPASRPTADQLLEAYGTQWAMSRRRAGATVFEGNWGPADDILQEDEEMIDV